MFTPQPRHRRRMGVLVVAMLLIAMLGVGPTSAITNGEPDGTDHPFVGSMVLDVPGEGLFQMCSGTLLTGGWFLTASHCLTGIEYYETVLFPGSHVRVTFDPTITGSGTFYDYSDYFIHEEYFTSAMNDAHDVGLIKLEATPALPVAQLPTVGLLDDMKADHLLKDTMFTAVGYGTVRNTQQGAFASILDNLDRNQATQGFWSLTGAWLRLPMVAATGDGGTCYGDSGGPHFLGAYETETNIVASITVTGDAPCKALDTTYRMDTEETLDWLDGIMNP